jgi:RHS repeat-associated protein
MSGWLSQRTRRRGLVRSRSRLRAVAFATVTALAVMICVPAAVAAPTGTGGGVPSPKMFGYAAGPVQHVGTAAGKPHYVPASATRTTMAPGGIKGHAAPVPALAPPPVGSRTLVTTGSAQMAAGHLVVGSASAASGSPQPAASTSPSASPSVSPSPSPSGSASPSAPPSIPASPASSDAQSPSASPSPAAAGSSSAPPSVSPSTSGSAVTSAPASLTALMTGGGTDNASYSVASSFDTVPMADQTGRIAVTLTNTGTSTWSGYALGTQVFPSGDTNGTGTPLTTGANVTVSGTVAPQGTATVESVTPAENPGSYEICWDVVNASGVYFSAEGGSEYCAPYTIQQYAPVINEQEPLPGTDVDSQTPELSASAVVPGGYPANPVYSYAFQILNGPNPSTATVLQSSGWVASSGNSWTPTTSLTWGTTYYWEVTVSDAVPPPSLTGSGITWTTPISFVVGNAQPTVSGRLGNAYQADDGNPIMTSELGGTDYSGSGKTVDTRTGNVSLQATDAQVATVGPALSITRTYNSLDPRTSQALGAGWSSVLDMSLVPDSDGSGALILTLADGQQVRFAKNSAGGYAPPEDMYAVVTALSGGGFSVTDQTGTTYDFAQASGSSWLISQITDNTGKSETFTYSGGSLTTITNTTSGRALHLTWSTPSGATYPHVATIATDPVTAGQPNTALTWTYGYNGDLLTSACSPVSTTACTTYGYITNGSHAPTSVLNANPTSYYRLDDASGTTAAANQIPVDDQTTVDPPATEMNTAPGASGPVPGVTATSFNGSSSWIPLDGAWCTTPGTLSSCSQATGTGRLLGATSLAVSMWFKTTAASGVLAGLSSVLPGQSPDCEPNICFGNVMVPLLWIGSNGDLQGLDTISTSVASTLSVGKAFSSPGAVDNGAWHQAVLIPGQALYLDGIKVASDTSTTAIPGTYATLGTGAVPNSCSGCPYGDSKFSYFNGSLADLSIYQDQLPSPGTVAAQYAAETHPAAELATVTSPAGRTQLSAIYDTVNDRVKALTDASGGSWAYSGLVPGASTAGYDSAVMASSPEDFWPLNDASGPLAHDLAGSVTTSASPRPPATYANVTLGVPGPESFANGTAASFNGTTSQVSIPGGYFAGTGAESAELWFSTKAPGTVLSSGSPQNGGEPVTLWVNAYHCLEGEVGSTLLNAPSNGLCGTPTVTDGKWHQAVLTLSPGTTNSSGKFTQTATLYQDASAIATAQITQPATGSPTGYVAYIGSGPGGYLNGSVADVSLYASQLSSTDVTSHYDALKSQDVPTTATPSTPPVNTETVTATNPVGATTTDVYSNGALVQTTNVLGGVTYYGYDGAIRASTVTNPDGESTYSTYDAHNNVTSATTCVTANNCQTSYASYYEDLSNPLDPRNDEVTDERDPRSSSPSDPTYDTVTSYTPTGQIASKTSPPTSACPSGCTTAFAYTAGTETAVGGGTQPAGLLASVTSPGGGVTSYAYDAAGDVMKVTNPVGLVTTYTYDNLGRELTQTQISDTYPAGLTTSYTYDGLDRPVTVTDPPVTDRVTGAVHTEVTSYTYDADSDVLTATESDATGGDPPRTVTNTYNSYGELASIADPQGNAISYTYNALGDRATETDPNGQVTAFAYDPGGDLISTTLEGYTGNPSNPIPPQNLVEESRAYDPAGRLASVTNAIGTTVYYTYYNNDQLASSYVVVSGSTTKQEVTTFGYDAAGNQVTETDPGGLVTNSVYNALSQLVSQTQDPSGSDLTKTTSYDADGNVITATMAQGGITQTGTATYNAADQELSQTVQDGSTNLTTIYTRDERGLITSVTDPDGNTTHIANDEDGRPVVQTDPAVQAQPGTGVAPVTANPVAMVGYDTFGDQVESADADGNVTTAAYDTDGNEISVTDPSYTAPGSGTPVTGTTTMTYDALGQETKVTDPLGNVTQFSYDQLGDLASQTDPGGGVWAYTYDPAGRQTSVTDPTGAQTQATYDGLGNLITTTDLVRQNNSAAYTTTYGYNDAGEQISQTTPTGVVSAAAYNPLGELTSSTDGARNTTTYAYNLDGNVAKTTLPDGTATTLSYDPAGRLSGMSQLSATGTVLRSAAFGYDADGHVTSATDFNGNTSTETYDATGMPTSQTQPVSAGQSITVGFGYDLNGNQTSVTDGNGNTTYTTYNSLGLPETITEPTTAQNPTAADSTITDSYDANGDLVTQDLPGGVQINGGYDAQDDLTSLSGTGASAPTATRTFTYDEAGRMLTAVTGAAGTQGTPGYQAPTSESFSYDDRGLLLATSGTGGTSSFTYNASGQLASDAGPAGTSTYTYNGAGLLATDTDAASGVTGTYSYNNLDQVSSISYGTGNDTQSFGYDGLHRLASDTITTASGAQVAGISYGYDNNDNVTSMTTSGLATAGGGTGTVTDAYGYDEANRLTSWTATPSGGTATTATYGYDADGNMTNDNGVTNTFDARDELVSDSTGYTFTWAANGDLSQQGTPGGQSYSFSSDAFGQQITDLSSSYTWDALDRLVTDTSQGGSSIALTYDGMTNQVASDASATYSRDPAGQITGVNSAAGGQMIALDDGHSDLSGLFTASGTAMTGSTTYDPWGQVLATAGPAVQVGYQGQWTDPATTQVDMGARFYSPAYGGFANQDTAPGAGDAAVVGLNAYADDNPMSETDPSGHDPSSQDGTGPVTEAQVQAAAGRAAQAKQRANKAEAAAQNARNLAIAAERAASADAVQARALNSKANSLWAQYNSVNTAAKAAYTQANAYEAAAKADRGDAEGLESQLMESVPNMISELVYKPGTANRTVLQCRNVLSDGVVTPDCTWRVIPGTPGTWSSKIVQKGMKEVENQKVASEIKQLNQAADHLDTEAAQESARYGALSAKASTLFGEWESTREEASVAHGDAVQAANDAAQDWNTYYQLAQVASADEQAATQAEKDYESLERAYNSEQNKAKGKGKKGKGKAGPKPPPKPQPPITGPPEGSGPPGTGAPGTSPGGGGTAPAPTPPDGGPPGLPKKLPATQGPGSTQGSGLTQGSGQASSEPSPWAKSPPDQDPPRDEWIAHTGTPLKPPFSPADSPEPPSGFWRKAVWFGANLARIFHNVDDHSG